MKELSPVKQSPPVSFPRHQTMVPAMDRLPQHTTPPLPQPEMRSMFPPEPVQTSYPLPVPNLYTNDSIPDDFDDDSLITLSPSFTDEDYLFSLSETDGIVDFFQDYDIWDC